MNPLPLLKKGSLGLLLALAGASAMATTEPLETIQLNVFGLNCGPCGEAMRQNLQEAAGAKDLVANLECGKIYAEVPKGHKLNEGAITLILIAKGYTLKGSQSSPISTAKARELGDAVCKM